MKYIVICFLVFANMAAACSGEKYKKYISAIEFKAAPHICGSEVKMLALTFVKNYDKGDEYFNGASLYIRDANGKLITKTPLNIMSLAEKPFGYACINPDYVPRTTIEFYTGSKTANVSEKNGGVSKVLSVKASREECQLPELIEVN